MFNEKLKEFRKKANLTQEELAEKINVSRQTIVKWESGESEPIISIAKNIAEIFGVTIEELVGTTSRNKEISITKKVWTVVMAIIVIPFTIMIITIIDPYVEEILNNMSDNVAIAMIAFIVISLVAIFGGRAYLKRYSIKHNNKQIFEQFVPKDIFGRKMTMYNKKTRFALYFLDTFVFILGFSLMDIFTGDMQFKDIIMVSIVVGIPAYIIETILNENRIKKFNKMK